MSSVQGQLTTKAQKYLWQKGWWEQHQRLLEGLSQVSQRSRFTFSGDIHAQGAIHIEQSAEVKLDEPLVSVLVGPVSTSDATWPSAARGIPSGQPEWLATEELHATSEVNGFALLEFTSAQAKVRLFDCGGFDLSKEEDGRVQSVHELVI